jgi:hypothetical protein
MVSRVPLLCHCLRQTTYKTLPLVVASLLHGLTAPAGTLFTLPSHSNRLVFSSVIVFLLCCNLATDNSFLINVPHNQNPLFAASRQYKIFFFSTASRPTLGPTQSPIQWVPGALSPGVKQWGHEANHSPPSSAEVKKDGAIPPLPLCLHDIVLT